MARPHVLLDLDEVRRAVKDLSGEREFVIDVETTKKTARANRLLWVGLGAAGRSYLIPVGHPKGVMTAPARQVETEACLYYSDKRRFTDATRDLDIPDADKRLSHRKVKHTLPPEFAEPPKQLYSHEVCGAIEPLLWSDRAKIGHNLKFDLLSLAKYFDHAIAPGPYHDTIIIRHCLNEDLGIYGLKHLVCEWFNIPWQKRATFYPELGEKGVENFGLDVVGRYLAKDLRYCWMMKQSFYPQLAKRGVLDAYNFEMSMYPVIMAMEYAGFPVETSNMDMVREDLERQQQEIKEEAWSRAGDEFVLSNTDAKRWIMFGEGTYQGGKNKRALKSQNLRVISRTKEGNLPQVTQQVLEIYAEKGNRMARLFLDWSISEKLRGTFIGRPGDPDAEKDEDKPTGIYRYLYRDGDGLPTLHTGFKLHGTVTGRLSSAEPNLQQLPRGSKIRSLFVAGDDHVLIVADYDQIELRCLAYAAKEPAMTKIFRQGRDIHAEATATAMRIDPAEVTPDLRQLGKTLNFATGYGAGADRIAAVAKVSKKRGQQFLDRYYDEFAALEPWKARLLKEVRARCDMTDSLRFPPYVDIPISHRRRRLPDLMPLLVDSKGALLRAERQAVNAYVQGFAANITKMAMRQLNTELEEFPAQILAQVHDEIVVRVHKSEVDGVLDVVQRVMSGITDVHGVPVLGGIPLVVSAACGPSWAEAKQ